MTIDITPQALADELRRVLDGGLFGFDVDGVLAPIVEHADDSRLLPGTRGRLARLCEQATVIVLSGRSLDDLERLFHFPTGLHVVGSHGLETRDGEQMQLDPDERRRFADLERLGAEAVEAVGDGAWLEHKPASVVVHTRSAESSNVQPVIDALVERAVEIDGTHVQRGHEVIELMTRTASKGDALMRTARESGCSRLAFFGDDLTDETAFAQMGESDVSVRVGPGETLARFRIPDPEAVAEALTLLIC